MPYRQTTKCQPYGSSSAMTLYVSDADFDIMRTYAEVAANVPGRQASEVCGYAFVRQINPQVYQLLPGSVFITTQEVAPGMSKPDASGEADVMDRDDQFEPDEPVYRLLWHSHMQGEAAFSGTDLRAHEIMGATTALEAMFFLVLNTDGDATANFEQYRPHRIGTQIRVVITEPRSDDYEALMAEFMKKRRFQPSQAQRPGNIYLVDNEN